MGIRTKDDYVNQLRKRTINAYMFGEKVDNIVDNPYIQVGINSLGTTFESAHDPRHRDLATVKSHLINERINRWSQVLENEQDAIAKAKLIRQVGGKAQAGRWGVGAPISGAR